MLKTPFSQKMSANSAKSSALTFGITSLIIMSINSRSLPLYCGRTLCGPRKVVTISTGWILSSSFMARSCFNSVSQSMPYPLLPSTVVTPNSSMRFRRSRPTATSSSSVAFLVGLMVALIPPPRSMMDM